MTTVQELSDRDLETVASGKDVPYVPPLPFFGRAGMGGLPAFGTVPRVFL